MDQLEPFHNSANPLSPTAMQYVGDEHETLSSRPSVLGVFVILHVLPFQTSVKMCSGGKGGFAPPGAPVWPTATHDATDGHETPQRSSTPLLTNGVVIVFHGVAAVTAAAPAVDGPIANAVVTMVSAMSPTRPRSPRVRSKPLPRIPPPLLR
jgi:hypothetical protein